MVRPSGRRGDADLGPVTDRIGRVKGRLVTASSRGVRGQHSTSDIPITPTPLAPGFHHGTGEAGSSTRPPAVPFRSRPPLHLHLSHTPLPYEPYGSAHPPSHHTDTVYDPYLQAPTVVRPCIPYRSAFQEPILYDGSQARHIGVEFFDQMLGAAHQNSSCSTHVYSHTEYGVSSSEHYVPGPGDRDHGLLKYRSRYVALTGWELTDSQAWMYLYFPMFAPPFRHSPEGCKPYMQMFPKIGYKSESKLLDIRLRLDMMIADEVRWMPYRTQDVRDCWVSTWHGFIAYVDCVEPYMADRVLRQFGFGQCIPATPSSLERHADRQTTGCMP
ncbi:hypothetical protein M9H77_21358 [Catharanthus roseus]|uniref:Uncharacterized protein n=1 Tax=Catharanthus roseus TaxID=4058 RepID=A0ACC0AMC9_CATRO|nr:hypothetical protein M9H77_21358 [Catharanthus roseus]